METLFCERNFGETGRSSPSDETERRSYGSDLSDEQWALVEPRLPAAPGGGRHRTVNLREVVKAIFYGLFLGDVAA